LAGWTACDGQRSASADDPSFSARLHMPTVA
jgi:hypothetical protein